MNKEFLYVDYLSVFRKIISIFIVLFVYNNFYAQPQGEASLLVKYDLTIRYAKDSDSATIKEIHRLYTGDKVSMSVGEDFYLMDSIGEGTSDVMGIRLGSIFSPVVYKDIKEGSAWVSYYVMGDNVVYKEPLAPLENWIITGKAYKINGYNAFEATGKFGGRNWTAWFTPDVPISDGPYVFNNLPGLIIELYDKNREFYFELISLEKLKTPVNISAKKDEILMEKKEFKKGWKKFQENRSAMVKAMAGDDVHFIDGTGKEVSQEEFMRDFQKNSPYQNISIEKWK